MQMDVFLHFFPKKLGHTDIYSYFCGKISYQKHQTKKQYHYEDIKIYTYSSLSDIKWYNRCPDFIAWQSNHNPHVLRRSISKGVWRYFVALSES